jgi:hypothetical protein
VFAIPSTDCAARGCPRGAAESSAVSTPSRDTEKTKETDLSDRSSNGLAWHWQQRDNTEITFKTPLYQCPNPDHRYLW